MTERKYWKIGGFASLYSTIFFVVFGVLTVLIPNKFFARMTPVTAPDYIFLIFTSLLLGTYLSFHQYQKKHGSKKGCVAATSGGVFGFLGFGCSICNKLLILLLGVAGVLAYVEPYRPLIGSFGIGLMVYAIYIKGQQLKNIN
jgi:hypothetical protein